LRTDTDVELIAHAYERWGLDCPAHLLGDFAFAIWDRRLQRLFCARDPIGVKPLYYRWESRRLLFASEVAAMFEDSTVPRRPHEPAMTDYLLMGFRDADATYFDGVNQLRPAHTLRLEEGRLTIERYWDADEAYQIRHASQEEYEESFRALFTEAVRCRMTREGPVGILLSGGIDSTTVASMAATIRRRVNGQGSPNLIGVTALTEGFLDEDQQAVQRVRDAYGLEQVAIPLPSPDGTSTFFEAFLEMAENPHYDIFFTIPSLLRTFAMRACRVILTGFGADEFSQHAEDGFLTDLLVTGRLRRFAHEYARSSATYGGSLPPWRAASRMLWEELPSSSRRLGKRWLRRQIPPWVNRTFARRVHMEDWRVPEPTRQFPTRCQQTTYWGLTRPAMSVALNQLDGMAARFSLECRHPYLDRRLIECFLAIPSEVKMRFGYRKQFVQHALRHTLPVPVRTTESLAQVVPWRDGHDPLYRAREVERIRQALGTREAMVYQYLDWDAVQRLLNRFAHGQASPSARNVLWNFAKLEPWLQRWFGAAGP
jgi:asparagine synthase (glutamine-hydrolysing)